MRDLGRRDPAPTPRATDLTDDEWRCIVAHVPVVGLAHAPQLRASINRVTAAREPASNPS